MKDYSKAASRAIGLVRAKFTDPVVLPQKGREEFYSFLHNLFGSPSGDGWKKPAGEEELEDDMDFDRVEYFETPNGPLVAAHLTDYARPVIVVVNRKAA